MRVRCIEERNGPWHHAKGKGDSWFQPIACSRQEGIVAPGNSKYRFPTCPDCIALIYDDESLGTPEMGEAA